MAKNIQHHYLLNDSSRYALIHIKRYFTTNEEETLNLLRHWLIEHEHYPPLELIWWFHKERILFVPTYFYIKRGYRNYLYQVLEEIYSLPHESVDKRIFGIMSDVLCALINRINHTTDDSLKFFISEINDNVIVKIMEMLEINSLTRSPIFDVKTCSFVNQECMQIFAYRHIKYMLSLPTEYSLNSIVEIHTKRWTSNFLTPVLKEHINEILSVIPVQKVIEEIKELVNESHFNWKYVFIIISVMVKNIDNTLAIKGVVDTWLKQSLNEEHMKSLYLAVLIARHCCYEKARYFQSYANWFSSINFKNSKFFALFFKFLTDIVPYEPPLYLKIHLNKVPSAPQGCQSLLMDYILLAKTRLADLNEAREYIGLFGDFHETDEEGQQTDVARVIAYYIENKEIAKPLLEAYVLRRQYYEKVFLKQLLKVSEREDVYRAEVIRKLHSMGKIPTSLFNSWNNL
uniref:Fanconi_A_N domain-containing protein n=1 Tax=Rhodnius prolixus TaxID=13249 RepID=T1HJQ5_RHOPR